MKNKIAVIGENAVQKALHQVLESKGVESEAVSVSDIKSNKSRLKNFNTIVLPFPSKGENISFIRENDRAVLFDEKKLVVGGLIADDVKKHLESNGIKVYDYFSDDTYVLKNAYLTYQGVLRLLFENTDTFIAGKTALVTGYGRIAKSLCAALKSLGLKVYIAVRSDINTAEASMSGFDVIKTSDMKGTLFYFDFIFNTVPFNIFDEKDVKHFKDSALYFEIASEPYGASREHFGLYGKKYISASALPGKFFPMGVAENIADYLSRKGVI